MVRDFLGDPILGHDHAQPKLALERTDTLQHSVQPPQARTSAAWVNMCGAGLDIDAIGEPGWDRTSDLLIKSQLLYH
jgi:hypothetical protein